LPRQAQVRAGPHGHAGLAVIAEGRGYDAIARAPEFSLAVPTDQHSYFQVGVGGVGAVATRTGGTAAGHLRRVRATM
jgi:hypothetical protein